jgi:hypothetical protein
MRTLNRLPLLLLAAFVATGCAPEAGDELEEHSRVAMHEADPAEDFCGQGDTDHLKIGQRIAEKGIATAVLSSFAAKGFTGISIDLAGRTVTVGALSRTFNICSYDYTQCAARKTPGGICGDSWSASQRNCTVGMDGDRILLRCGVAPKNDSILRHELVHVVQFASSSTPWNTDCYWGELYYGKETLPARYYGTDHGKPCTDAGKPAYLCACADPCTTFAEAFADYIAGLSGHYGAYWLGVKTNASTWFSRASSALGKEMVEAAGLSPTAENVGKAFDRCLDLHGYLQCWQSFKVTQPNLSNTLPPHLRHCTSTVAPQRPPPTTTWSQGPSCQATFPSALGSCPSDRCGQGGCCGWKTPGQCSCGPPGYELLIDAGTTCQGETVTCPSPEGPRPQGACRAGKLWVGVGQSFMGLSCGGCSDGWVEAFELC